MRVPDLTLRPLDPGGSGERVAPLHMSGLSGDAVYVIGRGAECDWTVPDPGVSRRHAVIRAVGGEWLVSDSGSRHGTSLNGVRLDDGQALPIRPRDELMLGSWRCRCGASGTLLSTHTIADEGAIRPGQLAVAPMEGLAQARLDAVLAAARNLSSAGSREDVARILLASVSSLDGCSRAAVVRLVGEDEYEFLGDPSAQERVTLSRSLLRGASEGRVVQLSSERTTDDWSRSLIEMSIQSALCAPLMVSGRPDCFLYIDTRSGERPLERGAAAFARAVADIGSLAMERLIAAEMASRREQLDRDLLAARAAQELLLPPREGGFGGVRYVHESLPGRLVAGDLFDVVPILGETVAFYLGDVSGKGIGAGVLMAAVQSQLRTLLGRGVPLAEALGEAGSVLAARSGGSRFVTLMAGIWTPSQRRLELADAGHGMGILMSPGSGATRLHVPGGMPLGVVAMARYETMTLTPAPGTRLILMSDGAVEQPNPQGRQFGFDAVLGSVTGSSTPSEDVSSIISAVHAHASGALADDLTVASVELG